MASKSFFKQSQIYYLKNNDGFVAILGDTTKNKFEGIDVVSIDHDDFADWIAENISRLSRESLIYQVESKKLSDKSQYWIVFLKGSPNGSVVKNFDRMLKSKPPVTFWTFRQHAKALPRILDMQKGDKIIFLFVSAAGRAQPRDKKTEVKIFRFYICNIIEPYYMALDNARGLFFEDQNKKPEIGDRRWPHFIDFEIKKAKKNIILNFGRQGDFAEAFSSSFNHGDGTPYPLSRAQFELLKDKLYKLVEETKNKG